MFDNFPDPATTANWRDTLSHGDVVSYRFLVADPESEAPKARPCLVLDVETLGGRRYALLAYGTIADTPANRGRETRVVDPVEIAAAGLSRPTRFVGARRILVSLDHPAFAAKRSLGTPVMGRLTGSAFVAMNRVRGRIHAEADIAAEARLERARAAEDAA